jgi:hypothetical protein
MKILALAAVLFLAGCAASTVQSVAQVCGVYSSTLISLSVYKKDMTESQIADVDDAVKVISPTCEGSIPDEDADVFLSEALDELELILLELQGGS